MSAHHIDPRLSIGSVYPPQHPPSAQLPPPYPPSDSKPAAPSAPPPAQQQQQPRYAPNSGIARPETASGQYHHHGHAQPYYQPPPYTAPHPHAHPPVETPRPSSISNQASPEQTLSYVLNTTETSPAQAASSNDPKDDDSKRPRACEACRGLKVRCDQDPNHPEIPCKRCAKAGRQCVITQPTRKRQKKADSRVAELEKKLDALTAALQQQSGGPPQYVPSGAPSAEMLQARSGGNYSRAFDESPVDNETGNEDGPRKRQRIDDQTEEGVDGGANHISSASSAANGEDPVTKTFNEIKTSWAPTQDAKRYLHHLSPEEFTARINSLIAPGQGAMIFDRYINYLMPHMPAVVFPTGTTAEQVFKDKPILYVSILSAASFGTLHPDICKALAREAIGAVADCVVRNGAKSLELIQAMQVMALWYKPPEKAEQTNFYQIIHMAAVMALDIGLGKRFNPVKARRGFGGPNSQFVPGPAKTLPQDSDTLEARRAWLGCYYLCASASMVLRRPNLVRWTNYMKECIEVLESHPDAHPTDKLFCQHVKIQHICEDIGLQFLMDDNTATISITDPKVTYALNVLENQLKAWKERVPEDCRGPGIQFFEHVTALYLHEIALHFNHNIEDFRLPFTEESLKSVNNTQDTLTQNQMAALEACLRAAHGILDTMLSYDKDTIKSLPMLIFFVRCVYAIVILIKMHVAVCTPNSELGKMMKPEDLKVDYYIDSLLALFSHVSNHGDDFRPHPKILRILTVMKDWFGKHKENVGLAKPHVNGNGPSKEVERKKDDARQTPLDLLSHVAASNQRAPQHQPSLHAPQRQQQHNPDTSPHRQRPENAAPPRDHTDWTFNTPSAVGFTQPPPPHHPAARFIREGSSAQQPPQPAQQQSQQQQQPDYAAIDQQQLGMPSLAVDPSNPGDYGWASGFDQAMDIALGGVDGLQGGGLDNWFLGDGMAPFGFNGDMGGGW